MQKDAFEMSILGIFIRKTAIAGVLLLLFLGAISTANAIAETGPLELADFSTFLGGTGDDHMDVAFSFGSTVVDSKGNIIVVGRTTSTDFPLKDAFQDHVNGYSDGTISKFHPNGSLLFSTYFGGSSQELITDVAVDSEDNIIIAGITGSSDLPLMDALQSTFMGGSADGFIAKFSEDGQSLLFSTYFGGTVNDWIYTMNVDSNDRIAISGATTSTDFPLLNPYQDTNSGALDIFLSFFEADGQSLLFSTYLGTTGIDHGRRIGFDSQGNILLTGIAAVGDLATEGAYQEEHAGGSSDAYLAKFDTAGALVYFTFLGGTSTEWGNDLAVDSEDNVVITGFTMSDDFPILNSYQDERVQDSDMFITKLTPDGQSVVFSTYMGGSSTDIGNAITVDPQDRIIVAGQTKSADFPTTLSYESTESYYDNVTLTVLSKDGEVLLSMIFGGANDDVGISVAWHSEDKFILVGYTDSTNFPTCEACQGTYGGEYDMFVVKMDLQGLIDIPLKGFTIGPLEAGLGLVIIAVVALLFLVRKRGR